jgi:feruloyl esterase
MLRLFCLLAAASLGAALAGTPCAKLTSMTIPGVTVDSAEVSLEGTVPLGGSKFDLPQFCRVQAVARPTPDSEIHLEIWMPAQAAWNGKFLGTGNGGYSGALSYPDMAKALTEGYATAGHDTGHTGSDLRFALGHPEKLADYAFRAVHVMTTTAKLIVREHLGRFADKMYFSGCSAGGHQALSEVQRYPDDYDGVIAGAPANSRLGQTFGFLWSWMALHDSTGAPLLKPEELKMVTQAAVKACDANDGLSDGLIEDPRRCQFDPAALACDKENSASRACLTQPQVEAIRKVYAGVKNPRTGEQIFAGWSKGSESFGASAIQSWGMYLLDPPEPMRVDALRYFLFHDPSWDWRTIDWDRDVQYAQQQLSFLNANETNLAPFASRGGKLILYAGGADPVVPLADTVNYYDGVVKAMGGIEKTRAFARLFLAPGMGHCGGGPGPNRFDAMPALEQWVAQGSPPAKLVASHQTAGKVDRTRPLCPYPEVARSRKSDSANQAADLVCVANSLQF